MKINQNVVYKEIKKRVNIIFSPEAKKNEINEDDITLAELLSSLKSFYKFIEEARKKINLINPLPFPNINESEEIYKLVPQKNLEKNIKNLLTDVSLAIDKYKLTYYWQESLVSAILTHTLLIPAEKEINIFYYSPEIEMIKREQIINDKKNIIDDIQIKLLKTLYSPQRKIAGIYFTENVSIKKIVSFVFNNSKKIREMLSLLPKRKIIPKPHRETFFWGQVAYILKNEGINKWSDMARFVEENIKNHKPIPDEIQIRKHYFTFLEYLNKIEQPIQNL